MLQPYILRLLARRGRGLSVGPRCRVGGRLLTSPLQYPIRRRLSVSLPPRLSRGPLASPLLRSHNEVADHRGPQGEASTEVSFQCGRVDHGGDTEVNQMSADDDDELCACDRIMMMVKLDSSL